MTDKKLFALAVSFKHPSIANFIIYRLIPKLNKSRDNLTTQSQKSQLHSHYWTGTFKLPDTFFYPYIFNFFQKWLTKKVFLLAVSFKRHSIGNLIGYHLTTDWNESREKSTNDTLKTLVRSTSWTLPYVFACKLLFILKILTEDLWFNGHRTPLASNPWLL